MFVAVGDKKVNFSTFPLLTFSTFYNYEKHNLTKITNLHNNQTAA